MAHHVAEGLQGLADVAADLEQLQLHVGAPVTSRVAWQATWARHHPTWSPWIVMVETASGGRAAAPLARRRRRGVAEIVVLGHQVSDLVQIPATDAAAAEELVTVLHRHLRAMWLPHLEIRNLVDGPFRRALSGAPRPPRVFPGPPSPTVRFGGPRDLAAYTSRNYRSQARHKWNRLNREGLAPEVCFVSDVRELETWIPRIMAVARKRDTEIAGWSRLDQGAYREFFADLLRTHAARGELELGLLLARGRIAAYSVTFLDGHAHRQWNKHHDSEFADYRPGHTLDALLLQRALDTGASEFDWMAGDEAYKYRSATDVVTTEVVHAAPAPLLAMLTLRPRTKAWLQAHEGVDPRLDRALAYLRRVKLRTRRAKVRRRV